MHARMVADWLERWGHIKRRVYGLETSFETVTVYRDLQQVPNSQLLCSTTIYAIEAGAILSFACERKKDVIEKRV